MWLVPKWLILVVQGETLITELKQAHLRNRCPKQLPACHFRCLWQVLQAAVRERGEWQKKASRRFSAWRVVGESGEHGVQVKAMRRQRLGFVSQPCARQSFLCEVSASLRSRATGMPETQPSGST